jgi:ATP-dependent Lon protease
LALPLRPRLEESVNVAKQLFKEINRGIILVCQNADSPKKPTARNLGKTGVYGRCTAVGRSMVGQELIHEVLIGATQRVAVQSVEINEDGLYMANVLEVDDPVVPITAVSSADLKDFRKLATKAFSDIDAPLGYNEDRFAEIQYTETDLSQTPAYDRSHVKEAIKTFENLNSICDLVAFYLPLTAQEKQSFLDDYDAISRFNRLHTILRH